MLHCRGMFVDTPSGPSQHWRGEVDSTITAPGKTQQLLKLILTRCLLIETCFPELKHRTAISDQLPAPRTDNLNIFKRNAISCEVILIIYIQLPALCTESLQIYIWKATTCRVIVIIYIQLPLPWTENLNICIWKPRVIVRVIVVLFKRKTFFSF